jgi:DNA-binding XRE family transcriptional regulator
MAAEIGVSVKTLWGWETDRWQPKSQGAVAVGSNAVLVDHLRPR